MILHRIVMSSSGSKSKGGSGASSSVSSSSKVESNNETSGSGVAGSSKKKSSENTPANNAGGETPKTTRGLDHGLEIPPFLVATSIVRAAKAQAVGKIAPSLMAPVTTTKLGGKCSLTPELKRRIRSEYFRILHQKRIRLKEDAKLAWMRNFNTTQGNSDGKMFFILNFS